MPITGRSLYWQFDDRNPAFVYGPGWSNYTDVNAHDSTLSYTSEKTNVTIQFYGKSIWLFGAIGRTKDWDQPVSSYTLDDRYISTTVAAVQDETAYNQLFAHFYDLNSSYHTLVVQNIDQGATLFLDYYLVEPIPPNALTHSTGNLQTGGEPLRTSISEQPVLTATPDSSGNASVGTIAGAVIGSVVGTLLIAILACVLWKRRKGAKPYYYKSATVYEVLSDECESSRNQPKGASTVASNHPCPSPVHSLNSSRTPSRTSLFSPQNYFPMPSEYKSQNLLAKSDSTRSKSSSHSSSDNLSSSPSDDSPLHEQRPLL